MGDKTDHKRAAVHIEQASGKDNSLASNEPLVSVQDVTLMATKLSSKLSSGDVAGGDPGPVSRETTGLLEDNKREESNFEDLMKLEFEPDFVALRGKGSSGATLEWKDVRFSVGDREILKGLDGKVGPTELCALLGPSGAGKTSLMNILAGRITSSKGKAVSGTMTVNKETVNPVEFRRHVSYVLQEDALFATSTTREALEFSAALRLPRHTTLEERERIVEQLLRSLGLKHVENTMCGSAMVRGLSGGEKKRVSIGVELVTNPRVLFLDEPSSGLDSYSAYQVVSILRALARSGCAVLCTIHQPSSEIFSIFDKCIALANGNVMYQGGVTTMATNLEKLGFRMPTNTNPADFIMVLAQTKTADELPQFDEERDGREPGEDSLRPQSNFDEDSSSFTTVRTSSSWRQMTLLAQREFRNLGRDKGALIGRFGITAFLNLLFGWIFFQAADPASSNYTTQSHFGALTNIFISALFGASQPPLLTFPLERIVFLREYATGTYSSAPYFFSKLLIELPLYLVTSLFIMIIVYWLIGFQGPFIILTLEVFLLQVVSASYAFLLGAIVSDVKQAQEFAPLVFVPQLLFTGFFISIEQIPASIRWIQYICSLKYGLNLAMITEFGPGRCSAGQNATLDEIREIACAGILTSNEVEADLAWLYIVILLLIFVSFRTGSLAALIVRARNFSS